MTDRDREFEQFLVELWNDRDSGRERPAEHYIDRYPACRELITGLLEAGGAPPGGAGGAPPGGARRDPA